MLDAFPPFELLGLEVSVLHFVRVGDVVSFSERLIESRILGRLIYGQRREFGGGASASSTQNAKTDSWKVQISDLYWACGPIFKCL